MSTMRTFFFRSSYSSVVSGLICWKQLSTLRFNELAVEEIPPVRLNQLLLFCGCLSLHLHLQHLWKYSPILPLQQILHRSQVSQVLHKPFR